jgi:hypothetical protein
MNASFPDTIIEPRWITYAKAVIFTALAVIAWGFARIFLVPKALEISHMAGSNPFALGWLWPATFFLVLWGRTILVASILALVLLEFVFSAWDRRRRLTLGVGIWFMNTSVLFGLIVLLLAVLIAAPSWAHQH